MKFSDYPLKKDSINHNIIHNCDNHINTHIRVIHSSIICWDVSVKPPQCHRALQAIKVIHGAFPGKGQEQHRRFPKKGAGQGTVIIQALSMFTTYYMS